MSQTKYHCLACDTILPNTRAKEAHCRQAEKNGHRPVIAPFEETNYGDAVACDFCNGNGDACYGGVIIGSSAVCGECCEKYGYYNEDYEYRDEIDHVFDRTKTFRENVLTWRKAKYGSEDLILRFYPGMGE